MLTTKCLDRAILYVVMLSRDRAVLVLCKVRSIGPAAGRIFGHHVELQQ